MGCISKSKWKFWFFRNSFITISTCTAIYIALAATICSSRQAGIFAAFMVKYDWTWQFYIIFLDCLVVPMWLTTRKHLIQCLFFMVNSKVSQSISLYHWSKMIPSTYNFMSSFAYFPNEKQAHLAPGIKG